MKKVWLDLGAKHWLDSKTSLYAVDSEVIPRLSYALDGSELLVLRDHDMYRMSLHGEATDWIRKCTVPEMAEEMAEIVDDMINYRRGSLTYGQTMHVFKGEGETSRTVQLQGPVLRYIETALLQRW